MAAGMKLGGSVAKNWQQYRGQRQLAAKAWRRHRRRWRALVGVRKRKHQKRSVASKAAEEISGENAAIGESGCRRRNGDIIESLLMPAR